VGPEHFEVDLGEEVLPVYLRGEVVDGSGDAAPPPLVVAVNGFVAGWGERFTKDGADQFFALTPQQLYAEGSNAVSVYEIDDTADEPVLRPVEVDWA
jgi:hypothetical protein